MYICVYMYIPNFLTVQYSTYILCSYLYMIVVRPCLRNYLEVMTSSDEEALRSYIQAAVLHKVRT